MSDEQEYTDWTAIARLNTQIYAEMILEALRSRNIPVVMRSESGHFGITGQMGVSTYRPVGGGYAIFVPTEFVKEAVNEGEAILGDEWKQALLIDTA